VGKNELADQNAGGSIKMLKSTMNPCVVQYISHLRVDKNGLRRGTIKQAAPYLLLAGGVGPLSNEAVKFFYLACSYKYETIYTFLSDRDAEVPLPPNIVNLSRAYDFLSNGELICDQRINHPFGKIVVAPDYAQASPGQIVIQGFPSKNPLVLANSFGSPTYRPDATVEIHTELQ
jgi:hypothetical protein